MSEQDARARAIAEQAAKEAVVHLERAAQCVNYWLERINHSTSVSPRRQKLLQDIIQDALSLTADTARAQAFEDAAKEVDALIEQERERLRAAYTLPYDVPAQRIRSATITAYTVVVELLRARATPGDTPCGSPRS